MARQAKQSTHRGAAHGSKSRPAEIHWHKEPEADNFPNAQGYLSLLFEPRHAKDLARRLKRAETTKYAAKDVLRAMRASPMGTLDDTVRKELRKIDAHERLSPILLVRDPDSGSVIVADGYHRLCAVYQRDEDANVPCRIVSPP